MSASPAQGHASKVILDLKLRGSPPGRRKTRGCIAELSQLKRIELRHGKRMHYDRAPSGSTARSLGANRAAVRARTGWPSAGVNGICVA